MFSAITSDAVRARVSAAICGVTVTPGRTQATVAAGAGLYSVHRALAAEGRSIPTGTCPTVGTAGLSLARIELPTVVYEKTVATVAATGPSALIWNDIPLSEIRDNPSAGIIYENDFLGPENLATGEGWTITQVNSGTLSLLAAEGGALHVDSGGNNASDEGGTTDGESSDAEPA